MPTGLRYAHTRPSQTNPRAVAPIELGFFWQLPNVGVLGAMLTSTHSALGYLNPTEFELRSTGTSHSPETTHPRRYQNRGSGQTVTCPCSRPSCKRWLSRSRTRITIPSTLVMTNGPDRLAYDQKAVTQFAIRMVGGRATIEMYERPRSCTNSGCIARADGSGERVDVERLIKALTASLDPASLMQRVAEQACAFVPKADGAAVTLLRNEDAMYVTVSTYGAIEAIAGFSIPRQGSLQDYAARDKRPKLSRDAAVDSRLSPEVRALNRRWGIGSWAVIPLAHKGTAIGSLLLASTKPHTFTDVDVDGMLAIGEFVSALIATQSQFSTLLTDAMADLDERGQATTTARFVASVMFPDAAETHGLQDKLDVAINDPTCISAVFQPVVDLASGMTIAFEGLSRFPSCGWTPQQWFGAARRLGCGVALERSALSAILTAASPIPTQYAVAINLSPTAVLDPLIHTILMSQNRPLIIEITEHEPFPDDLAAGLQPLRDRGIQVAVDDAGAGYASFTQLLRLRPDIIKIDGELIAGIDDNPIKRALATALAALASELPAKTVAEAIETSSELDTLIRLGIDYGQGFYLGRPQPVTGTRLETPDMPRPMHAIPKSPRHFDDDHQSWDQTDRSGPRCRDAARRWQCRWRCLSRKLRVHPPLRSQGSDQ